MLWHVLFNLPVARNSKSFLSGAFQSFKYWDMREPAGGAKNFSHYLPTIPSSLSMAPCRDLEAAKLYLGIIISEILYGRDAQPWQCFHILDDQIYLDPSTTDHAALKHALDLLENEIFPSIEQEILATFELFCFGSRSHRSNPTCLRECWTIELVYAADGRTPPANNWAHDLETPRHSRFEVNTHQDRQTGIHASKGQLGKKPAMFLQQGLRAEHRTGRRSAIASYDCERNTFANFWAYIGRPAANVQDEYCIDSNAGSKLRHGVEQEIDDQDLMDIAMAQVDIEDYEAEVSRRLQSGSLEELFGPIPASGLTATGKRIPGMI
ncbi:hypothetical protein P8C59_001057 [Phyllachora maydis]|uniref:Uncharacterized protein n=1 Tax=Phyllachora maydis TaxID=1825666 RepID=A0AAD9M7D8_9PEZI|nr:hypothetical protein P8C59_001057 [Phyllachora maydis]